MLSASGGHSGHGESVSWVNRKGCRPDRARWPRRRRATAGREVRLSQSYRTLGEDPEDPRRHPLRLRFVFRRGRGARRMASSRTEGTDEATPGSPEASSTSSEQEGGDAAIRPDFRRSLWSYRAYLPTRCRRDRLGVGSCARRVRRRRSDSVSGLLSSPKLVLGCPLVLRCPRRRRIDRVVFSLHRISRRSRLPPCVRPSLSGKGASHAPDERYRPRRPPSSSRSSSCTSWTSRRRSHWWERR
jgi:hypothetical protein